MEVVMKPVIGLIGKKKSVEGTLNTTIYYDYVHAIKKALGVPFVISIIDDDEYIDDVIQRIDGLLIPGGIDIHPKWFNQEVDVLCGEIDEELDIFELKMVNMARKYQVPILAICRGAQVLNVAYGGTLHQDILYDINYNPSIIHEQNKYKIPYHMPVHELKVFEDSILYQIFGNKVLVNSFHHQTINQLGDQLKITAKSYDGVVEAVESTIDRFVVGVQWHPEKMVDTSLEQLNLFKHFIKVCLKYKKADGF